MKSSKKRALKKSLKDRLTDKTDLKKIKIGGMDFTKYSPTEEIANNPDLTALALEQAVLENDIQNTRPSTVTLRSSSFRNT